MRTPTPRQFDRLRPLSLTNACLSWSKRDAEPLLKHGWITADYDGAYYQWVRITPDGLRALALAVERYGMPEMLLGSRSVRVCVECERDWEAKCRHCDSRLSRFKVEEVERCAA